MSPILPRISELNSEFHIYVGREETHLFPINILSSHNHQQLLLEKRKEIQLYLQLYIYSSNPNICTSNKNKPRQKNCKLSQSDISKKLDSDEKLTLKKWKRHFNNNLCIYCRKRSYQVKACSYYLSGNTRFQARCTEADLFILEATLTM